MSVATYIKEDAQPQVRVLEDGTEVHRTSPWSPPGCHGMGCGVLAYVKDGKCVKIEGDVDDPITKGRLCVRCLRVLDLIYHPDRIVHPMYRDPKDRGDAAAWKTVTWDWAYDKIEEEISKCKEKYGPNSLTVLTGTGREAGRYMTNTSARICVTTNQCYTQTGFSCMAPRDTVCSMIGGAGYIEYDFANGLPGRYDDPEFVQPKYLLNWGRDSLRSNPDGTWGHSIIELLKRGTKLINVDPRVNWLSTRSLYYMQLRPNTDTALAFGLLRVLVEEDLYDHEFVEKWCYGFDEFKERVMEYTVDWAAEVTEVPAETIRAGARCLAEKPWGLNMGLANDQNPNGVQSVHCLYALVAITGNLDIPGGTNIGWNITLDFGGNEFDNVDGVAGSKRQITEPPNPVTQAQRDSTIGLDLYPIYKLLLGKAVPDEFLPTLETDEPYPIRFCWILHTNPVAPTNTAAPQRWHQALKRMDFVVAQDIFMNPTIASCCDLFLPLATWLEHDGYITQLMGEHPGPVKAMVKSIEPVGECKSEFEIIHDLAQRPAFHDNFYIDGEAKVESIERYISEDLTKVVGFGHDWSYLKEHVQVCRKTEYRKYERGLLRPDGQPGFNTTTGKVELYSLMFAACGGDPLPYYEEPVFGDYWKDDVPADDIHSCAATRFESEYEKEHPNWKEEYPLIITTGARNWASFHSEHRQSKMLREIKPYPVVAMHPDLAAEIGVAEGEWVCLENPWGKCYEKAKITPIVKKNVVMADHGWWYPEEDMNEPNIGGVWKSNINTLIPNNVVGHYGFGAPMKCMRGRIVKADHVPLVEHAPQDLPDVQDFPGSIKNDPALQNLLAE